VFYQADPGQQLENQFRGTNDVIVTPEHTVCILYALRMDLAWVGKVPILSLGDFQVVVSGRQPL
jgi:hypothetical protein